MLRASIVKVGALILNHNNALDNHKSSSNHKLVCMVSHNIEHQTTIY